MSWQEELRTLDEDFSAGKITADQYRERRDQVLSSAATPQDQHEGKSYDETTQFVAKSQETEDTGEDAEKTKVVRPAQPPVSPPGGLPQQQYPQSPAGGFPQQPAWHQPLPDASPPWSGQDFPPIAPLTDQSWFQEEDTTDRTTTIAVSAVVILLVAGLAVGGWLLWLRAPSESPSTAVAAAELTTTPPPTTTTTTTTTPAPPPPTSNAAALVTPPGKKRPGGGPFGLAALKKKTLLPSSMLDELAAAKMDTGLLRITMVDKSIMAVLAVELTKKELVDEVADAYAKAQKRGGLARDGGLSMRGVQAYSAPKRSNKAVFRAVYVLHHRVIIVGAIGTNRGDAERQFETLLRDQVDHAPPTARHP